MTVVLLVSVLSGIGFSKNVLELLLREGTNALDDVDPVERLPNLFNKGFDFVLKEGIGCKSASNSCEFSVILDIWINFRYSYDLV